MAFVTTLETFSYYNQNQVSTLYCTCKASFLGKTDHFCWWLNAWSWRKGSKEP